MLPQAAGLIRTRSKHIIVDMKPKAEIVCEKGVHFQGLQFYPYANLNHPIFLTCSSFPNRVLETLSLVFRFCSDAGQVLDLRLSLEIQFREIA
jgi:hypothetical protein